MKIAYYGHSGASWINDPAGRSHIDIVRNHFSAEIVHVGTPQGSQERILFELKKTKDLDVAVIFHSFPRYAFIPGCNRDLKITSVSDKAKVLWTEGYGKVETKEEFEKEFFNQGNIKDKFETTDNFVDCLTSYKKYLYDADLNRNRFEGALVLIDLFCASRLKDKIVIHIADPKVLPNWFKFSSGVVSEECADVVVNDRFNGVKQGIFLPGNFTVEGNKVLAHHICKIINEFSG